MPERVLPERVGIAQVIPAHGALEHHGADLTGQRMTDPQRIPRVDEMVFHGLDDTAAIEGLTEQQGAAVAGGALAKLNANGPVAGRNPGRYAFTYGGWSSEVRLLE